MAVQPVGAASAAPSHGRPATADVLDVVVIGAGFGGLGAGAALLRAGVDRFVILEAAEAVGGTWRDNTYPGCACDIPSHLYSFSFAQNPDWSRSYPAQPEIEAYLERTTDDLSPAAVHPLRLRGGRAALGRRTGALAGGARPTAASSSPAR